MQLRTIYLCMTFSYNIEFRLCMCIHLIITNHYYNVSKYFKCGSSYLEATRWCVLPLVSCFQKHETIGIIRYSILFQIVINTTIFFHSLNAESSICIHVYCIIVLMLIILELGN